ncbi:hypothetical protein ACIQAL_21775 [Pseudomonas sp. NPDC088368]|uniref:DUF7661 family protein n=1 Tax=Pseudomonas sp. NPDC088368 TaxID=3364453 RepID=UPI0037FF640A
MMIFEVFGRTLGVMKTENGWQIFRVDEGQGKYSRLMEIVIPDFIEEHEIAGWFDDMYHESASSKYPNVIRLK